MAALAELVFTTFSEGHLRTALCVALARVSFSPSHTDAVVWMHAVALGALAAYNAAQLPNINRPVAADVSEGWQDYAPLFAASAFSYITGLGLLGDSMRDLLLAAALTPAVWWGIARGFAWQVLQCGCACGIGAAPVLLPGIRSQPAHVRWGVAGLAAAISYTLLPVQILKSQNIVALYSTYTRAMTVENLFKASVEHIFPVQEMREGYRAIELYVDPAELRGGIVGLFLASAHIQLSLGFLGLWYLRQATKNEISKVSALVHICVQSPQSAYDNIKSRCTFEVSWPAGTSCRHKFAKTINPKP